MKRFPKTLYVKHEIGADKNLFFIGGAAIDEAVNFGEKLSSANINLSARMT